MSASRTRRPRLRVLGVMTGTSCDGLDACCANIDKNGWQVLWERSLPYPRPLRDRVLRFQKPGKEWRLRDVLELSRDLGGWYGQALSGMIADLKPALRPHVISNHGQTVGHFPLARKKGVTLQMGDPSRIAQATGLTVVSNFRDGDMAAGGQGAPLVPLFHRLLAHELTGGRFGVAIHNLGGISNLTYVTPDGDILAFDTGPGNIWIDSAAEKATKGRLHMDRHGLLAAGSGVDEKALKKLLRHPYFDVAPPKSTGRDVFPIEQFLRSTRRRGASLVATATALTVETIARAYERWVLGAGYPLNAIYFCGGGANNPAVLAGLRARLPGIRMAKIEDAGKSSKYIEAEAFALFGFLALLGKPIGGKWTGAKGFGPPGHVVPGENWSDVVERIRLFLCD